MTRDYKRLLVLAKRASDGQDLTPILEDLARLMEQNLPSAEGLIVVAPDYWPFGKNRSVEALEQAMMETLEESPKVLLRHFSEEAAGLFARNPQPFPPGEREWLELAAAQLGLILTRREREAARQQLIHSSKMASVGQLTAGVAHELGSPLNTVLLALYSAEKKFQSQPEKAVERLARARKAANQARSVVEKLLTFSRPAQVDENAIDLAQVARDSLDFLAHQIKAEQLEVTLDLEPAPTVGLASQLQQVLVNLLLNARDALREVHDSRHIHVVTGQGEELAWLEVRDNGPGIAPDNLPHLFEPFFSTKEIGKGTGLGLWVSRQIVERQAGTLTARNRDSRGAVFRLEMPTR